MQATLTMPDDGQAEIGDVLEIKGPITYNSCLHGSFQFKGTVTGRCDGNLIVTGSFQ